MAVVVVCCVLLLVGLLATAKWGSLDFEVPRDDERMTISGALRRYIWRVSLLVWTTVLTAVFVAGPVGRLAMRLLAATAGDVAQGRKTEANEIVGQISVDGTVGLFVFVGLFAAFASSLAFFVVRRWLPRGRAGGLVLGAILLVTLGSRIDPLRADNKDFDIVGPAWVSIAAYSAMALVVGMAIVAFAGRIGRWLPLPNAKFRHLAPHAVLVILGPAFFLIPLIVLGGAIAALLNDARLARFLDKRAVTVAGRVVLAAITLVALPGFVSAISSIAGRGP